MNGENGLTRRMAIGAIGAVAALPAGAAPDPAARLHALLDASVAQDAARQPIGTGRRRPAFRDPATAASGAAERADQRATLAALETIDRAALGTGDRIAYDVLGYRARQRLDFIDSGLFEIDRHAPLDPSFGLQVELPDYVASSAPFADEADYALGLERLHEFAGWMRATVQRLDEGLARKQVQPRSLVEGVIAQVRAMLALPIEQSPFFAAVARLPATIPAERRATIAAQYRAMIEGEVYPAYAQWRAYLTDRYLPRATAAPGRWAMKGGAALYAGELRRHTTTEMSAAAIHAIGLTEVARIRDDMERTRAAIGFTGDLPAFFAYIRSDPRFYCKTPDELLGRFAAIEARIWQGIPRLFRHRPKAPFAVAPLPALGAQRGTGYYRASPDGTSPGILYFNMAMLPTRPIPTLETLTLHEGIPGHHFQIGLARENAALPRFLRFSDEQGFTAFTEGWGLYAETLGRELGLFDDPYQWFGHLDMEMLRAVRLVVDTGIHAERWGRQQAIDYMLANTSMAQHDVAVEIDRYIAAPGQACAYKIGELRLKAMRARATASLGARFDIRDFHDQLLGTGALPLAIAEAKIDAWIAGGGGAAGSGFA